MGKEVKSDNFSERLERKLKSPNSAHTKENRYPNLSPGSLLRTTSPNGSLIRHPPTYDLTLYYIQFACYLEEDFVSLSKINTVREEPASCSHNEARNSYSASKYYKQVDLNLKTWQPQTICSLDQVETQPLPPTYLPTLPTPALHFSNSIPVWQRLNFKLVKTHPDAD